MNKYSVQGLLVGPYLPDGKVTLGDIEITNSERHVRWESDPSAISAEAGANDSLITFQPNKVTVETHAVLSYTCQAKSSKEASQSARASFERLCAALSVGCIENTYYFEVTGVKKLAGGADRESPLSEPIRVVSYESLNVSAEFRSYSEEILKLEDPDAKEVVEMFGKALRASDTLNLYKVMEKIATLLKDDVGSAVSAQDVAEEKEVVMRYLESLLSNGDKTGIEKEKAIKEASDKLRSLNLEQTGKRIAATADYLGLRGEVAGIIKRAVKYRNKVIAHHDSNVDRQTSESGPKDIKESARFFVIRYLEKKFDLKLPTLPNVKHKDYWYGFTYVNSTVD